ncbi:MAG: tetratricopeptide repeat protein [Prosthecobacter sp.]|jgi:tetratricopeptide (TPR) repeat protein|nr:tetratricopeptide repeat protein [Prosthecobacter sp.]
MSRAVLLCFWALAGLAGAQDRVAPVRPLPAGAVDPLPPDTKILSQKAANAFGKGDWKTARAAYQEMLSLDAGNALVWANLGAVEQQDGQAKAAIECFEKSVQINPTLATSWSALGLIHSQRGDRYLAVSCLSRAIHEDPLDPRAHNYLAIALRQLGWHTAAEAELQRAIELKPDYGIAHFNLALLYVDQKPPSLELARVHYKKALSLGVEKDALLERRLKE